MISRKYRRQKYEMYTWMRGAIPFILSAVRNWLIISGSGKTV
jgi:hypothetical protein